MFQSLPRRISLGTFILLLTIVACGRQTPTVVVSPALTGTVVPPTQPDQAPEIATSPVSANTLTPGAASATVAVAPPSATATIAFTLTPSATPTIPAAVIDVEGVTLLPGFSIVKYADLYRPTALAFDAEGRLFATSFDGTVHLFEDIDEDGRADTDSTFSYGFKSPLGVTIRSGPDGVDEVYVSSSGRITILRDRDGDLAAEEVTAFARDLPYGLHQNDNLKFGPDGLLYLGVGSTCDACQETDSRSGTIMRFDPASGEGEVFASGMRNPYDLAFHPLSGELFATDNGRDDLGLDAPQEELNHVVQNGDYGWPDCWDLLLGPDCDETRPAAAFFEAHSSANSLDFYTGGRFPAEYQNNAFVAILGSWLKSGVQTGIKRVVLSPLGDTYQGETTWFARFAADMRPLGLIFGPDGALYVGDYERGAVYRLSYGYP